jgi:hypothetical protein
MKNVKEEEKVERCRCTRCKNEHDYSERVPVKDSIGHILACPRCLCHSYYDVTEYDFQYCTGYPVIGYCSRSDKCLLVQNEKRDKPSQLSKLRVRHYTKKALKNCKYFKPLETSVPNVPNVPKS